MTNVFTEHVVPSFGNLLALLMLLSPFPVVLRLRKTGKLGDINPLPYPMTCFNAAGWVAYGFAVGNPYIFPANVVGFLAGLFFSLTAYGAASRKDARGARGGTSAVVVLMGYYVVPLSTMLDIVRSRNAASIYPPLAAAAIANGTLWAVYGFAIGDINLWLPNLFGTIIGVVQLLLRMVYGARVVGGEAMESSSAADGLDAVVMGMGIGPPQVDGRTESSRNLLGAGSASPQAANGRSQPPPYDSTYRRASGAGGAGDLELAVAAAAAMGGQSRPAT
ncbi:Sugar transporter SWEET1 [Tetrabaena socialis]|uniref:Bidirectional sugar transporter SWEET n=1 Tax=Tetrabaena socialis TaxID=47790 RepID=A0A2J8A8I1_9CHLO|nr:Sugar transporter SWEET1 [Tetrabaena socialis]|eukprot:PNH08837.1 Sugar transporter SWEET1 [Tetrabaena socialis]